MARATRATRISTRTGSRSGAWRRSGRPTRRPSSRCRCSRSSTSARSTRWACSSPGTGDEAARGAGAVPAAAGARAQEAARGVTVGDGVKAAVALFVAAIAQVSIFAQLHVLGAVPDVLLVTLVAVSLLRGSVAGAVGGFFAGLLVDTASLGTLGLTSLVLTLAGYWIGRYGETTGRDRGHAPFLSVAVVTVLYQLGLLVVHFVLGESAPAGAVLRSLVPAIVLNLILTAPLYAVIRRLLKPAGRAELSAEVRLLG